MAVPTLTPQSGGQVRVQWTAPANNGSAVTGYSIWHKQGTGNWTEVTGIAASATSHTLTLTAGETYTIGVEAHNARGGSNTSTTAFGGATSSVTAQSVSLTASDPTPISLQLTIANHSGDWYYKYTIPASPAGTCSTVVPAGTTTAIARSLVSTTPHIFKAYSDSGCNTELATAASTSTLAPTLTATDATLNSLKLTMVYSLDWYYKYTTPDGGQCSSMVSAGTTTAIASGLTSGTSYTFKAYRDSACSAVVLAIAASASTLEPTLTATDATLNSLKLTIANHSGGWYYKYTTPSGGQCSSLVSAGTTTAIASGLTGNTSYTFKAYSDSGCTTDLATATATSTLASEVATSNVTHDSVTVTVSGTKDGWTAGSDPWSYSVSGDSTCNVVAGTSTSSTYTSLLPETSYTVTAFSTTACGPTSSQVGSPRNFTTAAAPQLTTTDTTANSLKLTIANHSGGWYYKYTTPSGGQCSSVVSAGTTTAIASGLTGNTSYTFKAYSDSGCTTVLATATERLTRPEKPSRPTAVPGAGSGKLTLTASLSGGAAQVSRWEYAVDNSNFWTAVTATDKNLSTVVEFKSDGTRLSNGTSYTFKVRAVNPTGPGPASDASAPASPVAEELRASDVKDISATLTIANYQGDWYYKSTATPYTNCSSTVSTGTTTAALGGLSTATSYTFKAYSDSSCTTELATVDFTTKIPTLEASDITMTTATLTVKYFSNAYPPLYYKRLDPTGEGCTPILIGTTVALTGLTAGTSYTYAFYGSYGNCETEETTEATRATFTTKSLPAPDANPVLSSSSITASTATLTIANYSGSWYYKRTAPTAGDHPYDTCSVAVDGTSVELTDLRAATSYSFTAYRDSGCTNSIDSISFTTAAPSPAVNLSTRSLTLREGSTATYTVRLNTQPTDTVTVAVGSSDTTVATVSPASLSFTTSNWEQPQSVTVTGQRDADTQDEAVTISHSAAGGGYDAVAEAVLGVNVSDEDVRGVSLSPESLTLTEGSTATYTVRLNTQPTDTVTVAVGSSDTTVATVSPASLSFTTSNWEQPQSVTVTGQRDADTQDEAVTISHSAAGGGYDAVAEATLGVNVSDEDVRGVSLSPESLTLREGSTATYTVRLNTQPTDTVTVAVGSNDTTVATVSPASLSFTTSNWEQPQSVMVTGVDNAVAGQNGAATISHEPAGGGYDAVAEATLGVNVSDDDVRGVSLSPESLTLTEGSTATYTVVLDSEPTDTVTVAVGSNDTTVATVSPASLSFTTSNWEQPQSVTVTGQRDADTQDGATTISHEPSGGGYGGLASPMVTVTVEDLGAQVSQRVNQVAEEVTPEVNRVVSANTAHAVAQRVSQVVQGRLPLAGTQISWGSLPNTAQGAMELARRWAVDGETISVAALLDNSSFNTSFPPQSQAAATEMGDGNAPSFPWGVWGAVDYGQIASGDDDNTTEWDAGVLTALVGADRMVNDRLLAGAALAWSSSSFDYQTNGRGGDLVEGKGEGSIELFTINPYLGWRLDDGQSLWTSVGYGWGALTIDDNVEARETSTDLTQWSLAAGASGVFYQSSQSSRATELEAAATSQLLWKADAWFSSLQVAGKDLLHDDQQQAYRLRLGVEGNRAIPLDNQALLTPSLGLFYRYEGGDGTTGSGLDLAAALRYDTPNGLRLEGRGRTLLLHSEELKDWGISGLVRYSPRGDDGFSLSLSPKWGRTDTNDLQQLWSTHQDQFSTTGDVSSALLLDAELRSPKLAMGSYVLTPALGFQFSPDAWTTRLGTALQFNSSLNLQLDLSRQQPEEGDTNHSLDLNLEMEF